MGETKKGVYIAGKLNAMAVDYLYNVHKLMNTAQQVKEAGYSILVPALDLLMGIKFGYKGYEDYFDNNMVWVKKSDAVFLTPGWETSSGTEREIQIALDSNVPVFDRLDEMYEYFKGLKGGAIEKLVYDDEGTIIGVAKHRHIDPEAYKKEMLELDKKLKSREN